MTNERPAAAAGRAAPLFARLHADDAPAFLHQTFREITVKAVITNQNGQKVTRGVIRAGVAV